MDHYWFRCAWLAAIWPTATKTSRTTAALPSSIAVERPPFHQDHERSFRMANLPCFSSSVGPSLLSSRLFENQTKPKQIKKKHSREPETRTSRTRYIYACALSFHWFIDLFGETLYISHMLTTHPIPPNQKTAKNNINVRGRSETWTSGRI